MSEKTRKYALEKGFCRVISPDNYNKWFPIIVFYNLEGDSILSCDDGNKLNSLIYRALEQIQKVDSSKSFEVIAPGFPGRSIIRNGNKINIYSAFLHNMFEEKMNEDIDFNFEDFYKSITPSDIKEEPTVTIGHQDAGELIKIITSIS